MKKQDPTKSTAPKAKAKKSSRGTELKPAGHQPKKKKAELFEPGVEG